MIISNGKLKENFKVYYQKAVKEDKSFNIFQLIFYSFDNSQNQRKNFQI
jgi:hypothetical protein